MAALNHKIDFAVVIAVKNANPNGDPLNGNRPRLTYNGYGEISDVCLKRKIRNRLMQAGEAIFVQSDDNRVDAYRSLKERAEGELKGSLQDAEKFRVEACKKWLDVRAFGQVFAFKKPAKKAKGKAKDTEEEGSDKGVSIGIRGPVSIHPAFSIAPVNVSSIQITKSVSGEGDGSERASDTMGMKHRVDHGLYLAYGSINPQLAQKTGFGEADAEAIKQALVSLFQNDASSARPDGSMEVHQVCWWKHNSPNGQYSSAKVHRTLSVAVNAGVTEPKGVGDYKFELAELDGLKPEVIEGKVNPK